MNRVEAYADLSAGELIERLTLAENICVLVGWTAARTDTDRGKALTELWMRWSATAGPAAFEADSNPHLNDAVISQLAAARDRTQQATLRRLFPGTR